MGADEEGMLECLKALRRARRALETDARRQLMELQFDFLGFTYSPRTGQARLTLRPCWHQGSSAAAVGQVHLLVLGLVEAGDLEEPAFAPVEHCGEDAWRVELRQAAPVDRTVHPHQRDRVQVADDAVGFDWLVGHFFTGLSKSSCSTH